MSIIKRGKRLPSSLWAAAILIAGFAMASEASAATPSVTTNAVNLRAGPGTVYPVVTTLPPSASVTTYGCLADRSWCDIGWGGQRGWVSAAYLQVIYAGRPVVITPSVAPAIGIAVVAFNQAYWHSHYVGRPWYGHWGRYYPAPPHVGPHPPRPPHVDRTVTRSCGGGVCSRTGVVTGPNGGHIVRHGTISRW